MAERFPTFRRAAIFTRRTGYLFVAATAVLAASAALIAMAWFLSIFSVSWPEMLRAVSMRWLLQALILAPVCVIVGATALLDYPLRQPHASILAAFLFGFSVVISITLIAFSVTMRNHQWDVGMGVAQSWRPSVFLLQTFMTRFGGYAFAAVSTVPALLLAGRAIRRAHAAESGAA